MSEENISAEATPTDFEPIVSEEQLEKRMGARLARERAKYADYSDLKTKAAEFDKLQEASKSEVQKVSERMAQLEKELESERFNTVRTTVASAKGVPAHRISGSTVEELETSAEDYLAEVSELAKAQRPKATSYKSGATGSDNRLDPKDRAAAVVRNFRGKS
jgi:histone H3/H4